MASLAARLPRHGAGDRLHLQHGPIDLILDYRGDAVRVEQAYCLAVRHFEPILSALVGDLDALRRPTVQGLSFDGAVAQRMQRATEGAPENVFVTPMAAVAGAVADDVLAASWLPGLYRASVNNGGDIAVRMAPGEPFRVRVCDLGNRPLADFALKHDDGVRGVATSGAGGRSHSLGVADSVTVLAASAAEADVAATLIANAVDVPGCERIARAPAVALDADSDLGDQLVVTRCGVLQQSEVASALDRGARCAEAWLARGRIATAALFLRGQHRIVGRDHAVQLPVHGAGADLNRSEYV